MFFALMAIDGKKKSFPVDIYIYSYCLGIFKNDQTQVDEIFKCITAFITTNN